MSLQILINGLATGSVYALIATGFALIFNVLKFSNFSHGATMTAAAFVAYFLVSSKGMGLTATPWLPLRPRAPSLRSSANFSGSAVSL